MNRQSLILIALIILFTTGSVNGVLEFVVYAQAEDSPKVKFGIQIYDVDPFQRTALVNITLTFEQLYMEGLLENEPIKAVLFGTGDIIYVRCDQEFYRCFIGSSGLMNWTLGGPLGKGEYFPFEEYQLIFQLANVLPGPFNMSELVVNARYSFAWFKGQKEQLLQKTYVTADNRSLLNIEFKAELEAIVTLQRKPGAFSIPTLFWLLVAPALVCYYLLAFSFLIRGPDALRNRFHVYIAIFIFSPSFLMAIQDHLPFRATLSIPEVLLVNLMISTAIFAISSIPTLKTVGELIKDAVALYFVFPFSLYLLTNLAPAFPISAAFVFDLTIYAYLLGFVILWGRCLWELHCRYSEEVYKILERTKYLWRAAGVTLAIWGFLAAVNIVGVRPRLVYGHDFYKYSLCGLTGIIILIATTRRFAILVQHIIKSPGLKLLRKLLRKLVQRFRKFFGD